MFKIFIYQGETYSFSSKLGIILRMRKT